MEYGYLLERAVQQIDAIAVNDKFLVKDLFVGTEWNDLEKGDKLGFGRFFKNAVIENEIPNVVFIGKAKNNSAEYRKVLCDREK